MTSLPIDELIDTQRGLISREIFVSPEFHKARTGTRVRPRLAVRRPREPDPEARRLISSPAWATSR